MAKVLNANDFIKKGLENLREMKGHVSHSTVEEHLELLKNFVSSLNILKNTAMKNEKFIDHLCEAELTFQCNDKSSKKQLQYLNMV